MQTQRHYFFGFAVFFFLLPAVACCQQIASPDLAILLSCVRTSAHDMLGPEFASSGEVHVRSTSSMRETKKGERIFYFAVITKDLRFGRIFRASKSEGRWWVNNDANFEGRPWRLTSDTLGGVSSTSFMESALTRMRKSSDYTLHLGPPSMQPKQCSTYVQYFSHTK